MTYTPMHIVNFPVIPADMPMQYGSTAEDIVDAVFREELGSQNVCGAGLQFIEAIFTIVRAPANWKAPVVVNRARDRKGNNIAEWVAAALVWYHAGTPRIVDAGEIVIGAGYAA